MRNEVFFVFAGVRKISPESAVNDSSYWALLLLLCMVPTNLSFTNIKVDFAALKKKSNH